MKKMYAFTVGLAIAGMVLGNSAMADERNGHKVRNRKAKNIIFMVPDGMGISDVTAARVVKNGPDGEPLHFEKLPVIGYQRTHSANSFVTDSAAAAGAWATGDKYKNGEISCHTDDNQVCLENPSTVLEAAQAMGKATGLVATSDITHATPAVWGAHTPSRKCETEIGRQLVDVTGVDVLLGGGIAPNRDGYGCAVYPSWGWDPAAVITLAESNGYSYVTNEDDMQQAVADGAGKILGLFSPGGKTPENFWLDGDVAYPEEEPTLQEMTAAALDILEEDKDGFFLMVEGSQIDWANHGNRLSLDDVVIDPADPYSAPNTQLGEMLGFDAAVETVMDWVNENNYRKNHTLVIIVADHETGGFHINGPYGSAAEAGDVVEAGWTSTGHTGQDTIIWSQGPGSRELGKALDNTDLYGVMMKYMK